MSQLHLVGEAPNVVAISRGHHHNFSSFSGTTREVAVLRLFYLFLRFMSQKRKSFSCNLPHASLKRPPWCGSHDHVADALNMIGRRPLIDDHTHTPKVRAPMKQPRDTDKKWGLVISQHQEYIPAPGAVSAESSGSSQHTDHHYGTP
jgi:hypothetical protein